MVVTSPYERARQFESEGIKMILIQNIRGVHDTIVAEISVQDSATPKVIFYGVIMPECTRRYASIQPLVVVDEVQDVVVKFILAYELLTMLCKALHSSLAIECRLALDFRLSSEPLGHLPHHRSFAIWCCPL